jgi:hypothetical protein
MCKYDSRFINGKFLYYGTNLASTIRSVTDNIKPHYSSETTENNIADEPLIVARGKFWCYLLINSSLKWVAEPRGV